MSSYLSQIAIQDIVVNPAQPRRVFSQTELQELADSLLSVGMIHPPTVRYLKEQACYELIAGERRWRAAQLAGFTTIEVIILTATGNHSAEMALVENIQRSDLNPLEIAFALKAIAEEQLLSQQQLATKMGKNRSTIANYLRLLSLPPAVQASLHSNQITMGHAKAILAVPDPKQQQELLNKVLGEQLSVRETEKEATLIATQSQNEKQPLLPFPKKDIHLEQCQERIQASLGTKVAIHPRNHDKGMICIDYYSLDDLERILAKMGIEHAEC